MKALKFLKHMKQTDTPYNFRECEINEAIEELEAIKLTRREWYQKGFNEAMKPKTCDECKWEQETNLITTKVGDKVDICTLCTRYENLQDHYYKKVTP